MFVEIVRLLIVALFTAAGYELARHGAADPGSAPVLGATIGALIGAGGFGQPILSGIRRDDNWMILVEGAIPAALLALVVQGGFDLAERYLVPKGLRL